MAGAMRNNFFDQAEVACMCCCCVALLCCIKSFSWKETGAQSTKKYKGATQLCLIVLLKPASKNQFKNLSKKC